MLRLVAVALMLSSALVVRANDASPADSLLRGSIAAHLVRPDGARFVPYRWEREPDIIALFFGADWCGRCHTFLPTLREVRDALRDAGVDTEVVYVSLDASESDMRRYMRSKDMPWPAIEYRRMRALPSIRALGGMAPPNLVLVDRAGRVLASGWDGRRYRGLQPVLATWRSALTASLPDSAHADRPMPNAAPSAATIRPAGPRP